jgi:hypothetical protein
MSRVNPPPHTSLPKKLAEILGGDREAVKYFSDRDFIQFQLWKRTGGGDDIIQEVVNETSVNNQGFGGLQATISRLTKRVEALEDLDYDGLSSKIARLQRLMDKLINELIEAVTDLDTTDHQSAVESDVSELIQQIRLLNARFEEAFPTRISESDI